MPSRILRAILIGIAGLALLVPAFLVRYGPRVRPHRDLAIRRLPRRVPPPAELPFVEPTALEDLTPEDARALNTDVPFSTAPNPPARPFRLGEDAGAAARATDCLAAAVIFEAGDDPPGERAVAQVVLNRVRHPAFPKTVCGVVFQGSERTTGCQFTFTCDGSLARRKPGEVSWSKARALAAAALKGAVYAPVGYSTHYHTDYVVPYWQSSLDKIVAVHTQLFYRWSGWWGTPAAFNRPADPHEPVVPALVALSDAHRAGAALPGLPMLGPTPPTEISPGAAGAAPALFVPKPADGDPNSFLVAIPAGTKADTYPALAAKACGDRVICKFGAWIDPAKVPTALPVQAAEIASMTFSYLRDKGFGFERVLWNCQQVKVDDPKHCMRTQVYQPAQKPAVGPALTQPTLPISTKEVDDPSGSRKGGGAPKAPAPVDPAGSSALRPPPPPARLP